jgi:small-conductance mechanosensitive channel
MIEAPILELVVKVVVIIAAFWLVGELLVRVVITPSAKRAGVSQGQLRIFEDGLRFFLMVLAIVAVVRVSGLASEFTTLTISGVAAIALSLALQTSLSNVIAGVLLLFDNTLRINDLIEYGGIKGQVVKIGLRSSWVKTGEGNIVIISNSYIANGPFINYTAGERLMKKLQH